MTKKKNIVCLFLEKPGRCAIYLNLNFYDIFCFFFFFSVSLFYVALSVDVCSCRFVRFFLYTFSLLIPSSFFSLPICLFTHATWIHSEREETFFLLYKKKYIDEETWSHYINSFNVIIFTFSFSFFSCIV